MKNDAFVIVDAAGRSYTRGGKIAEALKCASCRVVPRDRVAIVGPSGSGKSTLLHLMAGLDRPSSGTVGWPAFGTADGLRPGKIGFIAQEQSLVTSLSVLENIELPLLVMGESQRRAAGIAREILGLMRLLDIQDRLPDELSGGQLKRAAAARALATRPALILADEPTGQLDHETARLFLDAILEYLKGTDTALVIATHDREAARQMETTWKIHYGVLETGTQS